jgi:hypothetical protein
VARKKKFVIESQDAVVTMTMDIISPMSLYMLSNLFQIYAVLSLCYFLFGWLGASLEIKETGIVISLIQHSLCVATVNLMSFLIRFIEPYFLHSLVLLSRKSVFYLRSNDFRILIPSLV